MAFTDNFTDSNGTLLHNHTPSGGTAWTLVRDGASDWRINTNQLMNTGNGGGSGLTVYSCDDQGSANHYSQIKDTDLFATVGGEEFSYLCCRLVDYQNFIGWYLYGTGSVGSRLCKVVAGAVTDLVTVQGADEDVIKITCEGNTITFYIDDVQQGDPKTVTDHNTETTQGVATSMSSSTPELDDFEAGPMAGGTQTLIASAIASLEGFGTSKANFGLSPSAIASLEGFGSHGVTLRTLVADAIASEEAFGTQVAELMLQFLVPSAIASLEVHGTPQLNMALSVSGIASSETFGTTLLKLYLKPSSIATLEGFGTPDVEWRLGPSGIPGAEAFGSLTLALAVAVFPDGIGSAEGFGAPVFVKEILPYTAISKEAFGHPELTYMNLGPSGIVSLEALGTPRVNLIIIGESISPEEAFGTLSLATMASIYPDAITSLETFGSAFLYLINTVHPVAIGSLEAFGSAKLTKYLTPSAISSLEAIGDLNLILAVQNIFPDGIPGGEAFGIAQVVSRLIRMAVAEAIGVKELRLRSKREYSEGEDIINRILSSIWETTSSVSTIWETTKKTRKDE